jgi:hypothetical protein
VTFLVTGCDARKSICGDPELMRPSNHDMGTLQPMNIRVLGAQRALAIATTAGVHTPEECRLQRIIPLAVETFLPVISVHGDRNEHVIPRLVEMVAKRIQTV